MSLGGADLSRYDTWLAWLTDRLSGDADVRCAWVGGSAVTGGWDDFSDLDVEVLARPGRAAAVHDDLVAAAEREMSLDHVWRLPEATYPDGRQSFWHPQPHAGALGEPVVLLDVHVSDLSDEHRVVDPRRHGRPRVLHDPDGLIEVRELPVPPDAVDEALDQLAQRRGTAEWLVNRAIVREEWAEAVELHLRFGLHPLVRLLRLEHCPERHDYGLRYLRRDLPPAVADTVEGMLPGRGPSGDLLDLELTARLFAWTDVQLTRVRALRR
ncbi:hypothetical protein [Nocardioides bruguierae]|uniref:Uncharacterized protein n=1 Tax=Nocardioides bruguierae TaxID=2945102 RepID=A0A9X2DBB0_9ACTN|nr:hypothetical protein [Nocardioides bruguierae]MCM0622830.1 hypothetical protein [Nocardioides bruguierae]